MGNAEQRNTGWVTDLTVKENVIADSEWNPAEDLNQAIEAYEKMAVKGCAGYLDICRFFPDPGYYRVTISPK